MNLNYADRLLMPFLIVFLLLSFLFLAALIFFPPFICALIYIGAIFCLFLSYVSLVSRDIRNAMQKMSQTIDSLVKNVPDEVFSQLDDHLLSRFQHQLIQLADILKGREEQSRKQQKDLTAGLSHVAHQLKTPLTNLNIYTELLLTKKLSDKDKKSVINALSGQIRKLNWLMDQLIKMSRLDSGAVNVKLKFDSLEPVILDALDCISKKAEEKDIVIRVRGEIDRKIFLDVKWLSEAVFNLLDNAVKYSTPGEEVDLSVSETESFVYIEITDKAPGIPEKEKNLIFKRFYRGASSENSEGAGLGLYLGRQIVEAHNGFIKVRTSPDGNLFCIALPLNH